MNKDAFIKRLREHPLYKAALRSVDDEQAKRISSMVEGWLGGAVDGLAPLIQHASADPHGFAEAAKAASAEDRVVRNDPSGSLGK